MEFAFVSFSENKSQKHLKEDTTFMNCSTNSSVLEFFSKRYSLTDNKKAKGDTTTHFY